MKLTELFSGVWNMSLTASVIIVLVMLARLLLRKTPKIFSYALWAVVLFRLLCPVSIPSPVSLLGMLEPESVESQAPAATVVYLVPNAGNRMLSQTGGVQTDRPVAEEAALEQAGTEAASAPAARKREVSLPEIAAAVWAAGMVGLFFYGIGSDLLFHRKLRYACKLKDNIYLVDHMNTAFVAGLVFPKIYLPSDLPERQMGYIVAHEQCHIRRLDHVTRHLAFAALCLHWFNPLVWIAFSLSGKDMEMSCDEAVIRKLGSRIRAEYSASLLTLAMGKRILGPTPLAFGEGDTKGRIKNMAKWKKPKLWVSALCLVLCFALLVACGVNPEQKASGTEVSYHAFSLELPANISFRSAENGLEFTKDREILGGLVLREAPSFALMPDGYEGGEPWNGREWVQAMDIPEEKVTASKIYANETTEGVSGYELYGDLLAAYWPNTTDDRWIVHYFFIADEGVYDIWFDETKIDIKDVERIMDTAGCNSIEAQEEPAATAIIGTDFLDRCEEVLNRVQSSEGYQVMTYRWNHGGDILNDTSMAGYWEHGDNWLFMSRIPQDGYLDGKKALDSIFASMRWNGEYLTNYDRGQDENGCILWNGSTEQEVRKPWLAEFRWDLEKIDVLSTEDTNDHYIIHLMVEDHYDYREGISTDSYTVDFVFDKAWNFLNATQTLNFTDTELGDFGWSARMEIAALDGTTVAADMEAYRNGEKSAQTVVYPEDYTRDRAEITEEILSFSNGDGSASFRLTEVVPEPMEAKALTAKSMAFTGADAQKMALALFGEDAAVYEQCYDALSKADFEKNLAIWEHYSEEENLRALFPDMDGSSLQDYLLNVKMDIEQYRRKAEQAPEDPYVPYDWDSHADGQIAAMVKVNDIPYTFALRQTGENGVHLETCISVGIDSWLFSNSRVEISHTVSQLTRTEKPSQAQVDAAAQKARKILDSMGMGEWIVTQAYVTSGRNQTVPEYQIFVSAAQKLDGLEVAASGWTPDQWTFSTEASFVFAPDGTLMNFNCWSPLEIVAEETVEMLDMDTLLARGKGTLASYPSIQTFGKSAEYTVDLSDIHWGISQISSDANSGTYRYVPSLVFRGGIDFHGAEGETLFYLTEGVQDRLVLNALDGSVLTVQLPE